MADKGPKLGRPWADTLKGSHYANLKELRFEAADGEWRAAFAFDPERKAVMLGRLIIVSVSGVIFERSPDGTPCGCSATSGIDRRRKDGR